MARTAPTGTGGTIGQGSIPDYPIYENPYPTPPDADLGDLSSAQRDIYETLKSLFESYGLGTLAPKIFEYIQNGYSADTISILLQDTKEYKDRFAGNEKRRAAGLPVLSPAEYLATERGYRQVMEAAGLPHGFYDDPADFTRFIAEDKSVAEIQDRVGTFVQAAKKTDPEYRKMLRAEWGIDLTDGDIAAYMLDSKRALPLLQRQAEAFQVADAARRQGLAYSRSRAEQLAQLGITGQAADQAYGSIAEANAAFGRAGKAFGVDYGQTDAEDEILLGTASAKRKRERVQGAFSAYNSQQQSGVTKSAFGRDASSSY